MAGWYLSQTPETSPALALDSSGPLLPPLQDGESCSVSPEAVVKAKCTSSCA